MMNQRFFKKSYIAAAIAAGTVIFIGASLSNRSGSEREVSPETAIAQIENVRVQHARGEADIALEPKQVLVFDTASLDILDALGVKVQGVAGTRFPKYLSASYEKDDYLKIGSLFEPDYEVVHAAKPDLMITGGRSSAKYESLAKVGPTIDLSVDDERFLESVIKNTETLAKIFRKEVEGRALVQDLRGRVEGLKQLSAGQGTALIVMTSGTKMSAYGPGSRFGMIHTDLGIAPAVENLEPSRHGESIHAEFLLKTNPDWLLVVDRDAAIGNEGAAEQLLDNELVRQTTAWSKGQVVYLDPTNMYLVGGGVQALSQVIEQLSNAYRTK